jgi:hypothetical protein
MANSILDKEVLYKDSLRAARKYLLIGQEIIRPTDMRYREVDELVGQLEEMITRKEDTGIIS